MYFDLNQICFSFYLNTCNSSIIRITFYMFTYVNFDVITHFSIFLKKFKIIFRLCESIRMMILDHTKSKTKWVHFLSHASLPSFNDISIKVFIFFFLSDHSLLFRYYPFVTVIVI